MAGFRDYELGSELHHTGTSIIYNARKADQPKRSFAAKVHKPFLPDLSESQIAKQLELFVNAAEVQRKVADTGSKNWAPIYAVEKLPQSAGYVTDFSPRSLQNLIDAKVTVTHKLLCTLVGSIARGLADLEQACGRPHGNLKPSNILLASGKTQKDIAFVLSDPLPDAKLGGHAALLDLRATGQLIHQLVMHRPVGELHHGDIPFSPEWKVLGKHAQMWIQLCSRLLAAPFKPDAITLERLQQEVKRQHESRKSLYYSALLVLIAGFLVWCFWPEPPDPKQWDKIRLENLTWVMHLYQNRDGLPKIHIGKTDFAEVLEKAAYPYIINTKVGRGGDLIPTSGDLEEHEITKNAFKYNPIEPKKVGDADRAIKELRAFLGASVDPNDTGEGRWEYLIQLETLTEKLPAAKESIQKLIESVKPPKQIETDSDVERVRKDDIAENIIKILSRQTTVNQINQILSDVQRIEKDLSGLKKLATQELADIIKDIDEIDVDQLKIEGIVGQLLDIEYLLEDTPQARENEFIEIAAKIKEIKESGGEKTEDGRTFNECADTFVATLELLRKDKENFPIGSDRWPVVGSFNSLAAYKESLEKEIFNFKNEIARFDNQEVTPIFAQLITFDKLLEEFERRSVSELIFRPLKVAWNNYKSETLREAEQKQNLKSELRKLRDNANTFYTMLLRLSEKGNELGGQYREDLTAYILQASFDTVLDGLLIKAMIAPNSDTLFSEFESDMRSLKSELDKIEARVSEFAIFLFPDETSIEIIAFDPVQQIIKIEDEFVKQIRIIQDNYRELKSIGNVKSLYELKQHLDGEPADTVVYAAWLKATEFDDWLESPEGVRNDLEISNKLQSAFEGVPDENRSKELLNNLKAEQIRRIQAVVQRYHFEDVFLKQLAIARNTAIDDINELYSLAEFVTSEPWKKTEIIAGTIDKEKFADSGQSSSTAQEWIEAVKKYERVKAENVITYPEGFFKRLDNYSDWMNDIDDEKLKQDFGQQHNHLIGRYTSPDALIVKNEEGDAHFIVNDLDELLKKVEEASKDKMFSRLDRDADKKTVFKDLKYKTIIEPILVKDNQIIHLPNSWSDLKKQANDFLSNTEKDAWPNYVRSVKDPSVIFKYVPGDGVSITPFYLSLNPITYGQYAIYIKEIASPYDSRRGYHDGQRLGRNYFTRKGDTKRSWPENDPLGNLHELGGFKHIPVVWVTLWGAREYAEWLGNATDFITLPSVSQHEYIGIRNYGILYKPIDEHFRDEGFWKQACIYYLRKVDDPDMPAGQKFRPIPTGIISYDLWKEEQGIEMLTESRAKELFSANGTLFARAVQTSSYEINNIQGNVWEWCIEDNGSAAVCGYSSLTPANDKGEYTYNVSEDETQKGYCDVGFRIAITLSGR